MTTFRMGGGWNGVTAAGGAIGAKGGSAAGGTIRGTMGAGTAGGRATGGGMTRWGRLAACQLVLD